MPETPHAVLMNREEPAKLVSQHYGPQMELLTQMTNYASNLMLRAFGSSEKKLRDVMVCFALLKQFTSMLDAVDVLLRIGAVHAAFVPARVAFEASVYIQWILVSDGEKKANHYFVSNLRRERIWGRRVQKGTVEGSDFLKDLGQIGADILSNRPSLEGEGAKHIADVDRILSSPEFAPTDAAFEACKKKSGKPYDPEWYKVLDKRNLKAITRELGRAHEYFLYYGKGSQVTHSTSYKDHLKFGLKGASIPPVRDIREMPFALNFAYTTAMRVFLDILTYYRNSELPQFSKQYIEEWQGAFRNIPTPIRVA